MSDPRRLLDDGSGASPALRALLSAAKRGDDPRAPQLDALDGKLAHLMAPAAPSVTGPAAAGTGAAGAGAWATIAKLGGVLVALGVAGGGAWYVAAGRDATVPVAPPVPVAVIAPPPHEPPAPTPAPVVAPPPAPTPAAPPPPRPLPAAPLDEAAEARLVQAAQAALARGDAADALALTRSHAARFPTGSHAEERDRIAIEVRVRLGDPAARAAADRFFTRYPQSIYRARLEALLSPAGPR